MKKLFSITTVLLINAHLFAQIPNTDIWILNFVAEGNRFMVSEPVNITKREGYDNQPAFSPDEEYILYSSMRENNQTDIYKYKIVSKKTSQVTATPTSEYSPTFMPDKKNISMVMVEKDSAQRIWKFPVEKAEASSITMDKIDSVGYHCWVSSTQAIVFKLTNPFSLQLVNVKTQTEKFIADGIGRCFLIEDRLLYFTKKEGSGIHRVYTYNPVDGTIKKTNTSIESEDFAIANNHFIYVANNKLYKIRINDTTPTEITDLAQYGIKNITRIAIGPNMFRMAIVAESK